MAKTKPPSQSSNTNNTGKNGGENAQIDDETVNNTSASSNTNRIRKRKDTETDIQNQVETEDTNPNSNDNDRGDVHVEYDDDDYDDDNESSQSPASKRNKSSGGFSLINTNLKTLDLDFTEVQAEEFGRCHSIADRTIDHHKFRDFLTVNFVKNAKLNIFGLEQHESWESWSLKKFTEELLKHARRKSTVDPNDTNLEQKLASVGLSIRDIDIVDEGRSRTKQISDYFVRINKQCDLCPTFLEGEDIYRRYHNYEDITNEEKEKYDEHMDRQKILIKILKEQIKKRSIFERNLHQNLSEGGLPTTLYNFQKKIKEFEEKITDIEKNARKYCSHMFVRQPDTGKSKAKERMDDLATHERSNKRPSSDMSTNSAKKAKQSTDQVSKCNGCGNSHSGECKLKLHPNYNHSALPWAESEYGKLFATLKEKAHQRSALPKLWKIDPDDKTKTVRLEESASSASSSSGSSSKAHHRKKCKSCETCSTCDFLENERAFRLEYNRVTALESCYSCNTNDLKNFEIIHTNIEKLQFYSKHIKTLLDSGSTGASSNFIRADIAEELLKEGVALKVQTKKITHVCSAFNECVDIEDRIVFSCYFYNEILNEKEAIMLEMVILPTLSVDMIIGLSTIRASDLTKKIRSHFTDHSKIDSESVGQQGQTSINTMQDSIPNVAQPTATGRSISTVSRARDMANMRKVFAMTSEDEAFDDISQIEKKNLDDCMKEDKTAKENLELPPERNFFGTETHIRRTKEITGKFGNIFSSTVRKEPARIDPFVLEVDEEAWNKTANKRPARLVTLSKQYELQRQVNKMLANGVITSSQANNWSQVLLVPKPNDKWRFCQDVRSLNSVSKKLGYPIPNIKQVLERIGQHKPKYFATMDLTAGYHQAPMAKASQVFTAFICFMGLFEWLRVPMGLQGAPSYFQHQIATQVLAGLMWVACEAYIDDIIVFGKDEEEYLKNLSNVLERFQQRNILLNPDKCFFGLKTVEYLGHIISEDGLDFSLEKKMEVFDFEKPKVMKQMKRFIGLANFLRENVRNFSTITYPLQKLVRLYERGKVIKWTPEANAAFEEIKIAIRDCPKRSFFDPNAPIVLETDASDFGLGAYLYQIVDGKHEVIEFLSKTFNESQIKWNVGEKECYATYFALLKLEHLLGDREFTLKTDHRNHLFLHDELNKKLQYWKVAIQQFQYKLEHIPGIDNITADTISRMHAMTSTDGTIQSLISEPSSTFSRLCAMLPSMTLPSEELSQPPYEIIVNGRVEYKIPQKAYNLISQVHNTYEGHFGVELTMKKLVEGSYDTLKGQWKRKPVAWPYMRQHIQSFIKHLCPCCQKMSNLKFPINTNPFTAATHSPMVRLNWDTIGPLPADINGNEYIIVVIDTFSRFVELYPTKSTSAKDASKALLQQLGRFGCPDQIVSDKGSQFVNETIDEMCKLIGIDKVVTIAYSKEENTMVERANKEVMRHLRNILFHTNIKTQWGDVLPLVQRIINSKVHETTGVTPAQLLFGNSIQLSQELFLPQEIQEAIQKNSSTPLPPLSQYTSDLLKLQADVLIAAQVSQIKRDMTETVKRKIKLQKKTTTEFNNNSYVLMEHAQLKGGLTGKKAPNKLSAPLSGPYTILKKENAVQYRLLNLNTNKEISRHVQFLRPFHFNSLQVNPRDIARRDADLCDVKEILSHKNRITGKKNGKIGKLTDIEFETCWTGYEDDAPTWEPWSGLRSNIALHIYLEKIGQADKIPKQYKHNKAIVQVLENFDDYE